MSYRPFKDPYELMDEWDRRTGRVKDGFTYGRSSLEAPLIWVRNKLNPNGIILITGFDIFHDDTGEPLVVVDNEYLNMQELFDSFEFLNGSPCGVKYE